MSSVEQSSSVKTPPVDINKDYVTGLCESSASFAYVKNGNSLNLRFAIKRPEGDKNIIFQLQLFFQTGNVYNTGKTWLYCATSLSSIEKIINHFDKSPLRGRKHDEFLLWKKMFELKRLPRKSDMTALTMLAAQLSSLRSGNPKHE